ncbi:ribonuclease H family protein [uncultured Shewanella sp.]|uniref:ribonuclease H family protein n=1 Tax=Shewanella atlantica TaxID=271099 RepID=UPI002612CFD4|nr:ribonuclease H family protein [uncultured Shewanella sp.]
MAKKFYVVWQGRETGIFTNWDQTKKLVDKFPGARYKSFPSRAEAEAAFGKGAASSLSSNASTKTTSAPKLSERPVKANATEQNQRYDVEIYTDGGCEPNPGEAGSGIAVYRNGELSELWYGLYNPSGTNNTAELNALYQALLIAQDNLQKGKSVHILSDSQYSINCITNWAYGWKQKGWKRKTAGDIKNLEIIQLSHAIYEEIKEKLHITHVAAHVGIEGNELADRMSIYAIDQRNINFCRYPEPIELASILSLRAG